MADKNIEAVAKAKEFAEEWKRDNKEFLTAAHALSAGAKGISAAFKDTLYKGIKDTGADYSSLVDKYLEEINKTAEKVKSVLGIKPSSEPKAYEEGAEGRPDRRSEELAVQKELHAALLADKREYLEKDKELDEESWAEKARRAGETAGAIANTLQNLYVVTGSKNQAMFKTMKAFAIAETTIQTYRAAQGAYAAMASIPFVGPALGAAAAALAIAAGMARVKQISAMQPGGATGTISSSGHANPGYAGGSPSAYPVPEREEPKQTQNITLQIYNPLSQQNWAEIAENNIMPALKAASDRNVVMNVKTVYA